VRKALASRRIRTNVAAAARWCAEHDGAARAADLVEELAGDRERSYLRL
jgi:UDP:flavonoid glycosyltransferase YjiC (YdhE family)